MRARVKILAALVMLILVVVISFQKISESKSAQGNSDSPNRAAEPTSRPQPTPLSLYSSAAAAAEMTIANKPAGATERRAEDAQSPQSIQTAWEKEGSSAPILTTLISSKFAFVDVKKVIGEEPDKKQQASLEAALESLAAEHQLEIIIDLSASGEGDFPLAPYVSDHLDLTAEALRIYSGTNRL